MKIAVLDVERALNSNYRDTDQIFIFRRRRYLLVLHIGLRKTFPLFRFSLFLSAFSARFSSELYSSNERNKRIQKIYTMNPHLTIWTKNGNQRSKRNYSLVCTQFVYFLF